MERFKIEDAKQFKYELLKNPATSGWLIKAINAADDRDPVDALKDAVLLWVYLDKKLKELQAVCAN